MKNTIYTQEERQLIDYIENEKPQSIPNVENEIKSIINIVKADMQRKNKSI
jgi:hypothetical protein